MLRFSDSCRVTVTIALPLAHFLFCALGIMAAFDVESVEKVVHHGSTREELLNIYKFWSQTYDENLVNDYSYDAPVQAAKLLFDNMKNHGFDINSRILDMGSGTGLVGEALHKLGYHNVDAVDMSQESLDVAKQKGVYKNCICGIMESENSQDLGIQANQYDATISTGVFTIGHVKGKGFDDLVHVVKSGGLACFMVRDDVHDHPVYGYAEKMEALTQEKKWQFITKEHKYCRKDIGCSLYVYKVL